MWKWYKVHFDLHCLVVSSPLSFSGFPKKGGRGFRREVVLLLCISCYALIASGTDISAFLTRVQAAFLCGLGHRRKRSQKLSGINCVSAPIQLACRKPASFYSSFPGR